MQKTRLNFYLFLLLLMLIWVPDSLAQPAFLNPSAKAWADSVFNKLSYEEKIGQLFMIDAYSNRDTAHTNMIERLIRDYKIGGVIFFQEVLSDRQISPTVTNHLLKFHL